MQSQYKLLRVKDGVCHFSQVTLDVEFHLSGIEVTDEIRQPLLANRGEVSRKERADWIEAAVSGARLCAYALVELGRVAGCRIAVIGVVGVEVDTLPEDVACAAALATWQALCPTQALPAFDFMDSTWRIQWG